MKTRSYKGTSAFKLLKVAQPDSPVMQNAPMINFLMLSPVTLFDRYNPATELRQIVL
jgi:hypothetical protein